MKVSDLKQAIMLCRAANVTPFVWGHRGLGKSSAVAQLCATFQLGFVDFRLGQCEASDIAGLPDRSEDGRTVFLPPNEIPRGGLTWQEYQQLLNEAPEHERPTLQLQLQPRLNEGILFLDEPNRGQDDVLQAVFQLVLDRRVKQTALPEGWSVVCAGNFMEGYVVNGFTDPAFLDRFCHLTLTGGDATLDEWVSFMTEQHGNSASEVIEFAAQNVKHLDGEIEGQLGFQVQPSRRSWDAVVRVQRTAQKHGFASNALQEVVAGLVGRELAVSFMNYSCPIRPRDLVKKSVRAFAKELKTLTRGQQVGLMWGLVSVAKPRIEEDDVAQTACDFAVWLLKNSEEKDIPVAFCRALLIEGKNKQIDETRAAALTNKNVVELFDRVTRDNKNNKNRRKSFIHRLKENPELSDLLDKTIWGENDSDF